MRTVEVDTAALNEAESLANDMLNLAHDELLSSMRFLNRPLAMLPTSLTYDMRGCATDGKKAYFSPALAISSLEGNEKFLSQAYLHMVLHCLLGHAFPSRDVDQLRWSVACDLSVTNVMQQSPAQFGIQSNSEQAKITNEYAKRSGSGTASAFYTLLEKENTSTEELISLEFTLGIDDHSLWFSEGEEQDQTEDEDNSFMKELWESAARTTSLEAAKEELGSASGQISIALRNACKDDTLGLEDLLRQLCAPTETIAANPDEFDYIYYMHGLNYIGNVALVEPLEYVERPHFRDFILAIDTSGSVMGRLVEGFIRRACAILMDGSFGSKSRVRIVQCDCSIKDVAVITTQDGARTYVENLTLQGCGGTDFRPVFEYADNLLLAKEAEEIACIVYFTDGKGTFPQTAPNYDAAFVFLDEAQDVPFWATKAIIYTDELTEEQIQLSA